MNIEVQKPKLNLVWKAIFKDGTTINQFDGEKENKFQLVRDKFDKLIGFSLQHIDKPFTISVDLVNGLIYVNEKQDLWMENLKSKNNIRLIYFRRIRQEMIIGNNGTEIKKVELRYFIGYQYLDEKGKNRKVLIQLDQNSNIVIGD